MRVEKTLFTVLDESLRYPDSCEDVDFTMTNLNSLSR